MFEFVVRPRAVALGVANSTVQRRKVAITIDGQDIDRPCYRVDNAERSLMFGIDIRVVNV